MAAALVLSAVLIAAAPPGEARPLRPGETVLDRPRPRMTEHGGRLGRLWIRPTVTSALVFDDNVFANDAQRRSDLVLRTRPAVAAETDWRGHSASIAAAAERGAYLKESGENYLDLDATAFGRVQVTTGLHASATANWRRGHVPRQSADSPADAAAPAVFSTRSGKLLVKRRGETTDLGASFTARQLDYQDVEARGRHAQQRRPRPLGRRTGVCRTHPPDPQVRTVRPQPDQRPPV
ncbi:outer membrane beta-barrel protein [Rhodovibrio sodomensis]|uniref:outer membrane beta-barrel protein n=1 Tax=Rhodovibrio sodomensis TaxID=1088 RepID=UPI0019076B4C